MSLDRASAPLVFRPAVRRFVNPNGGDRLDARLEAVPDPDSDIFGGRVLEPSDLVETAVIQRADDTGESIFEIEEIDDESGARIDRPLELNLDAIGMAVQPVAAMGLGNARQPMRCLEPERLRYLPLGPWGPDQMQCCSDRRRELMARPERDDAGLRSTLYLLRNFASCLAG